jgi:HEPN superfamily RiboL-PSP-like protein
VFVADFANPKHERIKKFLGRFGYDLYNHELAQRLTRDFNACTNMVNHVVNQRNAIAHGDMVTVGTPTDLAEMVDLVKLYCRETDYVVGNYFSRQRCNIR